MPDEFTIIHYREPGQHKTACSISGTVTIRTDTDPGQVTCFICRKQPEFTAAQGRVGEPTPIKLSGVMQRHPVMAELYAEALARGEDTPRYLHDCSDCEYLGWTMHNGTRHEAYYCHAPEEGNVTARYGNGAADYHSGLSAAKYDPVLAMAVVRSIHRNLFSLKGLSFL